MAREDTPRHILVVEDDPNTAEMLKAYFSSQGYQISHAAWGEDALKLATEKSPDLVVLDIHLPDIDGYEVCMRLRSQRRTEHTPVIFLTERRERMDRLAGLELGAVDYITKPFDVQELKYRVSNILRRTKSETFLHPVTGLPTSVLIEEQITKVAQNPKRSLIGISLHGMRGFSNAYGFVTHDDVLRAVALILRNTSAELMNFEPFVGQLDTYQFILIAPAGEEGSSVMERLQRRLNEAVSFFYPHQDWESGTCNGGDPLPKIRFKFTQLPVQDIPKEGGLGELRQALFAKKKQA